MSRILDALRRLEDHQRRPHNDWESGARRFRVLTVTSNKGGVGKTTIATNLAVYLRALREDLPILLLGLDDQRVIDRMFAFESERPEGTVGDALREGSLKPRIRLGQYGVHYVPSDPDISELKRTVQGPFYLRKVLLRTDWSGIVIIDTKSDLEILTRNAIAASDLALLPVKDDTSLTEAQKVFEMQSEWNRPRERARILLSLMDLRVKYPVGEERDILAFLLSEIRRRDYPVFETFLSRSPKVESLYTNPERRALPILHGAPGSLVHRQMAHLAHDVLAGLERVKGGSDRDSSSVARKDAPGAMKGSKRWILDGAGPEGSV